MNEYAGSHREPEPQDLDGGQIVFRITMVIFILVLSGYGTIMSVLLTR
jgi:hypothetical protein